MLCQSRFAVVPNLIILLIRNLMLSYPTQFYVFLPNTYHTKMHWACAVDSCQGGSISRNAQSVMGYNYAKYKSCIRKTTIHRKLGSKPPCCQLYLYFFSFLQSENTTSDFNASMESILITSSYGTKITMQYIVFLPKGKFFTLILHGSKPLSNSWQIQWQVN